MRTLLIGFIAFSIWSFISTYIYVCKINGLCYDPITMQVEATNQKKVISHDSLHKSSIREEKLIPKDLIIYFAFDKYDFKPNETIESYFVSSKEYLDQNVQAKISIVGHTDATGSDEYNLALGLRRAQILQYYFEGKGMLANRIIIDSKGERKPLDDNNTEQGRANNRRSEITIKK